MQCLIVACIQQFPDYVHEESERRFWNWRSREENSPVRASKPGSDNLMIEFKLPNNYIIVFVYHNLIDKYLSM